MNVCSQRLSKQCKLNQLSFLISAWKSYFVLALYAASCCIDLRLIKGWTELRQLDSLYSLGKLGQVP